MSEPMSNVIESTRVLVAGQVALEWAAATKLAEDIEAAIAAILPSYAGKLSYRVAASWNSTAGARIQVQPYWPSGVIVEPSAVERIRGSVLPLVSVDIKTDPDFRPPTGDKVRP